MRRKILRFLLNLRSNRSLLLVLCYEEVGLLGVSGLNIDILYNFTFLLELSTFSL